MKKFLMLITVMLCVLCGALAFAACDKGSNAGNTGNGGTQTEQPGGQTPGGSQTEQPGEQTPGGTQTEQPGGQTPGGEQTEQPGSGGTEENETEGLQYQVRKDEAGNEYAAVVGLGTALDTDIVIPSAFRDLPVKEIGDWAFDATMDARNGSLTSISIPESVTWIGNGAFRSCSGLTSVTIGSGLTSIGSFAFEDCGGLERFIVDEANTAYSSQDGVLYDKAQTQMIEVPQAIKGAVTIPDSMTSIGNSVFRGCSGLTSITIPDNVTSIESFAFKDCSGLTSVTVGSGVTSIGMYLLLF